MKKCTMCDNKLQGNQLKYCSANCKQKAHYHKIKNNPNTMWHQTIRGLKRKKLFIERLGNKCSNCGYCKNIAALEFHHLYDKSFGLDIRKLSNTKLEILENEISKCTLLCANCHREYHYPEYLL